MLKEWIEKASDEELLAKLDEYRGFKTESARDTDLRMALVKALADEALKRGLRT